MNLLSTRWVHILCAVWDRFIVVQSAETMHPITLTDKFLQKEQQKKECCICEQRGGSSLECLWEDCHRSMHPFCAQQEGYLCMEPEMGLLRQEAYCNQHKEGRVSGAAFLDLLEVQLKKSLMKDLSPWNCLRALKMLKEIKNHYECDGYRSPEQFFRDVAGVFEHIEGGLLVAKLFEKWFEMLLLRLNPWPTEICEHAVPSPLVEQNKAEENGQTQLLNSPGQPADTEFPLRPLVQGRRDERVLIWDRKHQACISGPYHYKLASFLQSNLNCEVYINQGAKSYRVWIWDAKTNFRIEERVRRDQLSAFFAKNRNYEVYCNQDEKAKVAVVNTKTGQKLYGARAPFQKFLLAFLDSNLDYQVYSPMHLAKLLQAADSSEQKVVKEGQSSEKNDFTKRFFEPDTSSVEDGHVAVINKKKQSGGMDSKVVEQFPTLKVSLEDPSSVRCDVCNKLESYLSNSIIFCDGCDVAVHQACYGVKKIPKK